MASTAPLTPGASVGGPQAARPALRRRLLADRDAFIASPQAPAAQAALATHLAQLLRELNPEQLGVYWPIRNEFNAIEALEAARLPKLPLALPYAQRQPRQLLYRAWNGRAPEGVDECGLLAPATGPTVVPGVVLVPCVGYTRSGFRLGYGGGYFDRWLAQHPHVTAIGIAWSPSEIDEAALAPEAHDRPLTLVLTERGVVA